MGNPKQRIGAIGTLKSRLSTKFPHSERMAEIANRLDDSARGLIAVHDNPSQTITEAAHFLKVQEASGKMEKQRQKAFADVNTIMGQAVGDAQKRLDEKVKLKPGPDAAEIRSVFRSLDAPDQFQFLNRLAFENKGPDSLPSLKQAVNIRALS